MSVFQEQKLQSNFTIEEVESKECSVASLIQKKDYRALVKLLRKNPKSRLNYPKLKYEGAIYQIGQNVSVKSTTKLEYVAKLVQIINLVDDDDHCVPLVKVQWYYRKNELLNLPKEQLDCISENEVFKTNEIDYIEIDSILGLATILSFEEYDAIENLNEHTYFSRAAYINHQLTPPFTLWPRTCVCKRPPNPDLKYIFCEICKEWCHLKCVDLTREKAERINIFVCPGCKV